MLWKLTNYKTLFAGYDVVGLDYYADKRFDEETIKKLEEIS